jgi:hypothetical protein
MENEILARARNTVKNIESQARGGEAGDRREPMREGNCGAAGPLAPHLVLFSRPG